MENQVELTDVQGLIIKGYSALPKATFLMLHFGNITQAKQWISEIATVVTDGASSTKNMLTAVNIAFTNKGISALNVDENIMNTFPREFEEGMINAHRQRILGDFEESDPKNWTWGNEPDANAIHVSLFLYAKTTEDLEQLLKSHTEKLTAAGISIVHTLDTNHLDQNKEHFGFRDGIANPVLKNAQRDESKEHPANLLNPGEFIFGYENEYEKYPFSPTVPYNKDPRNLLKPDKNNPTLKDIGRNGSMLVFRQMYQDVSAFWKFVDKASKEQQVPNTSSTPEHLAAKMVGRWPDGSPLTKCPFEPKKGMETFDNFGYAKNDFDGLKCPIGAHIRRANPRDNFLRHSTNSPEKDIKKSEMFVKRFRILRRGRSYGPPLAPSFTTEDLINASPDTTDRGLYFLCFNTSIGRQFELVQQTWINNPKFAGLYEDPDPIVGRPAIMGEGATGTFTEQANPVRKKIKGIPRFVQVKGGAYLFMPGITVLKYLGSI